MSWASRRMRPRRRRACVAGPVGMIPAGRRGAIKRRGRSAPLEPVRLEEAADRIGDLLEALLADEQPVMRVRGEGLVARVEPLRQPLRFVHRDAAVEPGADDQPRYLQEPATVDRDAASI